MRNSECGINTKIIQTPLGWVGVAVSENGVISIILPRKSKAAVLRELEQVVCPAISGSPAMEKLLTKTVKQLERYFEGQSVIFDLPLGLREHTLFQQAVWKAAAAIPYGETRSYRWIAKRIGKPRAARAVGQAMAANPVPLLVP